MARFLEELTQKIRARNIAKGRAAERVEWKSWLDRMEAARAKGEPFDEPRPGSEEAATHIEGVGDQKMSELRSVARSPYQTSWQTTPAGANKWLSARLAEGYVLHSANGIAYASLFDGHSVTFLVVRYDPEAARALVYECNA